MGCFLVPEGGATRMMAQVYPAAGLPAGYLSSFLFGGVMIFCGFNTLASKLSHTFGSRSGL